MPFRTLKLLPGVNLERSQTLNQTQLAACNLIRFYGGLEQKLGGWQAVATQPLIGTCRGLHGWGDIVGNPYLAAGTEQRLTVISGGALNDITPLAATTNPSPQFTTTIGLTAVTIHDAGYSPNAGDWINLLTQVAVGGLVLFGYYQVQSVTDSSHYVIAAASPATASVAAGGAVPAYTTTNAQAAVSVGLAAHGLSAGSIFDAAVSTTVATVVISGLYNVTSVTDANNFVITAASTANASTTASENAGNARIQYLIPSGYAVDSALTGYGIGDYGSGDFGLAGSSQAIVALRQWSLDHWGQDLVANPSGGTIYYWQPPTIQPATSMPNAPLYCTAVFVMPQVQIVVALGAETGGTQEPLLVRWCDQGDFTDWTVSATNQAGSYSLPTGSKIVGGLAVGVGALVWTDVDVWSMTYLGFPLVFGFNRIATACGLVAQRAAGTSGNLVVWLSTRGFFNYIVGGGVTPVECPVWDFLVNNLDTTQLDQVHCAVNSLFNEMTWFFPIAPTSAVYSAAAPLGYVKFNYVENVWDYGQSSQYQRTAWVGRSPAGNPIGSDNAGLLQQHEIGTDANGAGMMWSWQTGYFDVDDGESFIFVDLMYPEAVTSGAPTIYFSLLSQITPDGPIYTDGPHAWSPGTALVPVRTRGRQVALLAQGSDLGTFHRLGAIRFRFVKDGRN